MVKCQKMVSKCPILGHYLNCIQNCCTVKLNGMPSVFTLLWNSLGIFDYPELCPTYASFETIDSDGWTIYHILLKWMMTFWYFKESYLFREPIFHLCEIFLTVATINTLMPRLNRRRFADDICKYIFLHENLWNLTEISLKFVQFWFSVGSDNGLAPSRRQANIWTGEITDA